MVNMVMCVSEKCPFRLSCLRNTRTPQYSEKSSDFTVFCENTDYEKYRKLNRCRVTKLDEKEINGQNK